MNEIANLFNPSIDYIGTLEALILLALCAMAFVFFIIFFWGD